MSEVDLDRVFDDGVVIEEALARAALEARREYVRLGRPMPVWQEGRVVWIPAAELDVRDSNAGNVRTNSS
jgi:hypothetical protein